MPRPSREAIAEREALAAQGLKRCSPGAGCGEVKPHGEFSKNKSSWDGLRGICRECDHAANARFREAHRDERRVYKREYQATNRDKIREYFREYRLENPWVVALREGYHRAVEAGNPAEKITQAEMLAYWADNGIDPWKCFYTGVELVLGVNRSLDHRVAISEGGTHTLANLVPCDMSVNLRKGNRTEEFMDSMVAA